MTASNGRDQAPHLSVLYQEIITALKPKCGERYLDATVGAGGHAAGILELCQPDGQLLGLDIDQLALEIARKRLASYADRVILVNASYITLLEQMRAIGWKEVKGIIIDLGTSSMQLDNPQRGFSFRSDGPLDMRFGQDQKFTASDLLNHSSEEDLSNIFWQYGEEPRSRQIARAICLARPLHTTGQLAEVITKVSSQNKEHIHPATRIFQAIRIAVNQELKAVEMVLPQAVQALSPGGRLAVISFHSLEDRLVKQFMRRESKDCICPPRQPVCTCEHRASIIELTRHPIKPSEGEILTNPRARSARLRVAEKKELA